MNNDSKAIVLTLHTVAFRYARILTRNPSAATVIARKVIADFPRRVEVLNRKSRRAFQLDIKNNCHYYLHATALGLSPFDDHGAISHSLQSAPL